MSTFETRDVSLWQRWANDFDNVSRLFADQFATLQRLGPYVRERHPELRSKYDSILARGAQHQATLATLTRLRRDTGNWLSGIGRNIQSAASASMAWLRERFGLHGVGAVPIVAIVGVVAAAGALVIIANWIRESFEFTQRLNALFRLEQSGHSPRDAAGIINAVVGAPGGLFRNPLTWIAVGAAALFFVPRLLSSDNGE